MTAYLLSIMELIPLPKKKSLEHEGLGRTHEVVCNWSLNYTDMLCLYCLCQLRLMAVCERLQYEIYI